ncbi:hypothetical protein SKAU_G00220500 [Synaphobranchus kaupii]|uniref:Uncharacterized protein n=1 Tax=Synaphobranchus kaupii TaxID=118154 RepID=A0A9Q1IVZ8_SYNKA|nr:hypothetical protein SKAU_G00220500 [Synaphobranchus kaupii]
MPSRRPGEAQFAEFGRKQFSPQTAPEELLMGADGSGPEKGITGAQAASDPPHNAEMVYNPYASVASVPV